MYTYIIYVYIRIHVVVQQKLTQQCKAIRPQLKVNFFKIQKKKKRAVDSVIVFLTLL